MKKREPEKIHSNATSAKRAAVGLKETEHYRKGLENFSEETLKKPKKYSLSEAYMKGEKSDKEARKSYIKHESEKTERKKEAEHFTKQLKKFKKEYKG